MKKKYEYKNVLLLSSLLFLLAMMITIVAWAKIPDDALVPTHWNAQGEVDNYGTKTFGLLMGPVMIFGLTILFTFIPHMEPRFENLQQSQKAYKAFWGMTLVFMLVLHIVTTLAAVGHSIDMGSSMGFLMGALFMAIGNYMGKIRSNFMFGIRTPWTLSSEVSWNKTHRLGGRLFFVTGLLVFISGIFQQGALTFSLLLGGIFLSVIFLYGYSYRVWKSDDDRKSLS